MDISREQFMDFVDALPEDDRAMVYHLVKRLIVAWDPDFTRLTPQEAKELEEIEKENDYIPLEEINWDSEDED